MKGERAQSTWFFPDEYRISIIDLKEWSIIRFVFWIVVLGILIDFVVARTRRTGTTLGRAEESPEAILKKRYARGEIGQAEYEKLKQDIDA